LKKFVNSPDWRGDWGGFAGVPGAGAPAPGWNICVKAPGAGLAAAGRGQSPSAGDAGNGELNKRENSLA
jgi:hypothetical protein